MTENEANKQLFKFGDLLLKSEKINYVAVVEDDNHTEYDEDYALEIGVIPEKTDSSSNIHILNREHILYRYPSVLSDLIEDTGLNISSLKDLELRNDNTLVKGVNLKSSKKFYFQDNYPGDRIYIKTLPATCGTIGALLELDGYNDSYFILSNYHVLMRSVGNLNQNLLNKNKLEIAKLHWAIYNDYYDLALARVNKNITFDNSLISKIQLENSFDSVKIGDFAKKDGQKTGLKKGKILSKNAYVKVGRSDKIFKNQILVEKISEKGDSGSIVLDTNNKAIGVVIGGDDEKISICNNISTFLNDEIIPENLYDRHSRNIMMPKIHVKSIYVKNSLLNY